MFPLQTLLPIIIFFSSLAQASPSSFLRCDLKTQLKGNSHLFYYLAKDTLDGHGSIKCQFGSPQKALSEANVYIQIQADPKTGYTNTDNVDLHLFAFYSIRPEQLLGAFTVSTPYAQIPLGNSVELYTLATHKENHKVIYLRFKVPNYLASNLKKTLNAAIVQIIPHEQKR